MPLFHRELRSLIDWQESRGLISHTTASRVRRKIAREQAIIATVIAGLLAAGVLTWSILL